MAPFFLPTESRKNPLCASVRNQSYTEITADFYRRRISTPYNFLGFCYCIAQMYIVSESSKIYYNEKKNLIHVIIIRAYVF